MAATQPCLSDAGFEVSTNEDDLDYVAMEAKEGALYATKGEDSVTIAFERTEADAGRTRDAYALFVGDAAEDILSQDGNAAILWDGTPTDDERQVVNDCLG